MKLLGKSVLELMRLIKKKEVTEKELFEYFLKRIKKYNGQLNAFLTVCAQNGYSVPLAVKDAFCTEGVKTTAASRVLDKFIPPYESTVTARLKEIGYQLLGKTNLDAWCHGSSTETSDFGPTKNPCDITRSPGGSSGGSSAAVSSYLAPAAIGSETAGSIRQPASWSGVVGLKPSYGRVSRYGLIAMGSSLDSPGPLTLTSEDAAFLLKTIAGKDNFDATTVNIPVKDYLSEMKKKQKFNIGVSEEYFEGIDQSVSQKVRASIKIFEKLGHKVKKIKLIHPKYAISDYTIIQRSEVSSNLSRYD